MSDSDGLTPRSNETIENSSLGKHMPPKSDNYCYETHSFNFNN